MSSVSGIRLPGLATGMDTESMIKEMLAGEQNKVDKVKQKEQTIKWQQEIYREVIKDIQGLNDKYFSLTSKDSILNASAWNTLSMKSSNEDVLTVSASAGAIGGNYKFNITEIAQPAKVSASFKSKDENLGLTSETSFDIELNDGKKATIKLGKDDTVATMVKAINDAMGEDVKASYSEMTGEFTVETKATGENTSIKIVKPDNSVVEGKGTNLKGSFTKDGKSFQLNESSNNFAKDGINYEFHSTGTADTTSKQNVEPVIGNMKAFVEDYNKLMDKMYDLVTQKTNRDYPPLTESQKKDMSEEEIERWEKKAKEGLLRSDQEMRKFIDDMTNSIFGDNMEVLNEIGIASHEDYNKKGQISLNEDKLRKALENNSDKVYEIFAKDSSSVMEKMKSTIKNYVGNSSSIFAKKAGIEKTASVANNFYSEQLKRQAETLKALQRKMDNKENALYKKFSTLEASMNKLNSQMSYFMQG